MLYGNNYDLGNKWSKFEVLQNGSEVRLDIVEEEKEDWKCDNRYSFRFDPDEAKKLVELFNAALEEIEDDSE